MSNFLLWWEQLKADFITCFVTKERWRYITRGLGNTLKIALVAVLIGIAIGSIVAIVRSAHDKNIHEMRPGSVSFITDLIPPALIERERQP